MFAYAVADGKKRWVTEVGAKTAAFTPIVTSNTVYQSAGAEDGGVSALRRSDGKKRWSKDISSPTQAIATDNALYIGETVERGSNIKSLSLSGGSNWTFEVSDKRASARVAPAVDGTSVYALVNFDESSDKDTTLRLYALAIEDGSKQWQCKLPGGSRAAPAVGNERIYISSDNGTIYAIEKSAGEIEWTFPTHAPVRSSPALYKGTLFAGNLDGDFYAINAADGQEQWKVDTYISNTNPAVAAGTVYVGGGPLFGFDVEDGSTQWSFREDAFSTSFYSPALVGDALYVGICLKQHPEEYYDNYLYQFTR